MQSMPTNEPSSHCPEMHGDDCPSSMEEREVRQAGNCAHSLHGEKEREKKREPPFLQPACQPAGKPNQFSPEALQPFHLHSRRAPLHRPMGPGLQSTGDMAPAQDAYDKRRRKRGMKSASFTLYLIPPTKRMLPGCQLDRTPEEAILGQVVAASSGPIQSPARLL